MPIRLVIADDHNVVREALRLFLSEGGEFDVVGEARDGAEAVRLAAELTPDVVLMDLLMPVMTGVEATRVIRQEHPNVRVLALTSVVQDASVLEVVRAGAVGYLLKNAEGAELRSAVRAAAAGVSQLSPEVAASLVGNLRSPRPSVDLTEREAEVLGFVSQGLPNKAIAARLAVSESTVKFHVASLMTKLGVQSRTQVALRAGDLGLTGQRQ